MLFNEGVVPGGRKKTPLCASLFFFFFPICPFVNNFLARVVCEQVLALANINILSKADGERHGMAWDALPILLWWPHQLIHNASTH